MGLVRANNRLILFLKKRAFVLLILSFLVLRLGILLTSVESVIWYEEEYRGTIAKELIEGLKVPLWDYQADHYDGGSLWIGVLAVPFFLLLGPNLFALKLVAVLFSLATLILTYFFFKRFFDRKTALWVLTLLIFSPPVVTGLSLVAIGSHPESSFFSIAMLFSLYQFLYGKKNKLLSLILFGLAAGLGFWFTSITLLTLLTCLVSWFLIERRSFLGKPMAVFLVSFLGGALPFILYNATHQFRFLWFLVGTFLWEARSHHTLGMEFLAAVGGKFVGMPIRILTLVFETFPFIFRFPTFLKIPSSFLTLSYGLVAWLVIGLFLWKRGRRLSSKTIPFLLFPFLFVLIYSASNAPAFIINSPAFDPGRFFQFRYFSPLYYFLLCLLAVALRSQKSPALFFSIFLILGLVGQGSLLFNEPAGKALHYRGYSYYLLGNTWGRFLHRFPQQFKEFSSLADRFPEPEQRSLYWGYSSVMSVMKLKADPEITWEAIQSLPSEYRPYFSENWGRHRSAFSEKDFDYNVSLGRLIPKEEQSYFYYGLATKIPLGLPVRMEEPCTSSIPDPKASYPRPFYDFEYFKFGRYLYCSLEQKGLKKASVEIPDSLGTEEKIWIWRGMGTEAAVSWFFSGNFRRPFDEFVSQLPREARDEFFWGVGWGLWAEELIEDRTRTLDWFHRLRPETQAPAWKGSQAFEKWYGRTPENGSRPWTNV